MTKKKLFFISVPIFILAIAFFFFPLSINNQIANGVYICGNDVSGLTIEQAENLLSEYKDKLKNETVISLSTGNQKIDTRLSQYCWDIDFTDSIDKAFSVGKQGNLLYRIMDKKKTALNHLLLEPNIVYDDVCVYNIASYLSEQFDIAPIEANVIFDPSEFDFFAENADSSSMFNITEGINGKEINKDKLYDLIVAALREKQSITIDIPFDVTPPRYTLEELEQCTELIFHSYSKNTHREDSTRSHNMTKSLEQIKGLVVMPGDTISFFGLIGEPNRENGYINSPNAIIASNFDLKKYFYGSLSQVATTFYNAAFMAGAEIVDVHSHTYPAFKEDYGYGMDACVEYGEMDLVFKNTSDYPMFFDAYYNLDLYGRLSYVDVDVYTMLQGDGVHIVAESEIVEQIAYETEYIEAEDDAFLDYYWELNEETGKMEYLSNNPKDKTTVKVYKVWYQGGAYNESWELEGGTEIKREEYKTITYPMVNEIIYIKDPPEE